MTFYHGILSLLKFKPFFLNWEPSGHGELLWLETSWLYGMLAFFTGPFTWPQWLLVQLSKPNLFIIKKENINFFYEDKKQILIKWRAPIKKKHENKHKCISFCLYNYCFFFLKKSVDYLFIYFLSGITLLLLQI